MSTDVGKAWEFSCHTGPAAQASKLFSTNAESPANSTDSSVFTLQLWRAAGLTPKLLGKQREAVQRDAPPSGRLSSCKQLARSGLSGAGLSSGSLSGFCCELTPKSLKAAAISAYEASTTEDASAAQLSGSTGHSPAPKGGAERDPPGSGPEASNGVSRARQSEAPSVEAAQAAQQRQVYHLAQQLQRCSSQGQTVSSGPGIAPDSRPCLICGVSCSVYVTVPGISAPLPPPAAPAVPSPAVAASSLAGSVAGSTGTAAGTLATVAAAGGAQAAAVAGGVAHALAAPSVDGSSLTEASLAAQPSVSLSTCRALQHSVSAPQPQPPPLVDGPPPLIGCSQCRKPMHLDCFVAHYNVVPARRDFTYCPAHVYVPKPKPAAGGGGGGKSHHKRERSGSEAGEKKKKRRVLRPPSPEEDNDDGDGDYVPRATTMRLRGTSPSRPARRSGQGGRLRTRSSGSGAPERGGDRAAGQGGDGGGAEGTDLSEGGGNGGERAGKRQRAVREGGNDQGPDASGSPRPLHESRSGSPMAPAAADQEAFKPWAPAAASQPQAAALAAIHLDDRTHSGGSSASGEGLVHPEHDGLERVRVPKHQRSARTPRTAPPPVLPGDRPRAGPSALHPSGTPPTSSPVDGGAGPPRLGSISPRPAADTPRASKDQKLEAADTTLASAADDMVMSEAGEPVSLAVPSAASVAGAAAAVAAAAEPAASREALPVSPRSPRPSASGAAASSKGGAAGGSQRGEQRSEAVSPRSGGSGGQHAAKSTGKSPFKSPKQRTAEAAPSKGEKEKAAPVRAAASTFETPAASPLSVAQSSVELKDEELARLLHEELNAPSRRRAKRLPDAFTTPPLSPLGVDRPTGSVKKGTTDRKSASATPPSLATVHGGDAMGHRSADR